MIKRFRELSATLRSGTGVRARLARGSFLGIGVGVAGNIVSFGTQLALARTTGPDDYGIYAIVLSWVNFLLIFATMGFDTGSLRFMSGFLAVRDEGGARRYARYSYRIATRASLLLGVAAFCVLQGMWFIKHHSWQSAGIVLVVLLPTYVLLQLQASMLQGTGAIVAAQAPVAVVRPLLFTILLGCALLLGYHRLSAGTALALNAVAGIACVCFSHRALHRRIGDLGTQNPEPAEADGWGRVNRTLMTMNALQLAASQQLGLLIVGILGTPRDAGIYSAANQLALPLSLGVQAVVFVSVPMMAALYAQGRKPELQRLLRLSVAGGLLFLVPGLLVLIFGGRWLLGLYGPTFVQGYPILIALGLMQAAALVGGVANALLTVAGRERAGTAMVAVAAATNLGLCLLLAGKYGMLGAAIAACLTMLLRTVLFGRYVWSDMGLMLLPIRTQVAK